jgi:hypothetical protein
VSRSPPREAIWDGAGASKQVFLIFLKRVGADFGTCDRVLSTLKTCLPTLV